MPVFSFSSSRKAVNVAGAEAGAGAGAEAEAEAEAEPANAASEGGGERKDGAESHEGEMTRSREIGTTASDRCPRERDQQHRKDARENLDTTTADTTTTATTTDAPASPDDASPDDAAERRAANAALARLAELFPDIRVEVFRELLARFDGTSRLQVSVEQLLRYRTEWATTWSGSGQAFDSTKRM
ncbi:hypothetical protein KEM52_004211 [Ascosphaera acerosa]|nr:hypothetical protein KEM52_004211 [Ascosphaera acerosa]